MKKLFFLAIFVFLALSSIFAYETDHLYVVGDACSAGWDPGKAIEMTQGDPGVFTWTGTLYTGETTRFKFLVARNWDTSITCNPEINEHFMLTSGVETDLYVRTGQGYDVAFRVPETVEYRIVVNLNTMKMTCTKVVLESVEDLTQLHIAGTAASGSNRIAMIKVSEGVFAWNGNMTAGNFSFFTEETGNEKAIVPDVQTPVNKNTKYNLFYYSAGNPYDYRFTVAESGNYTILVDLNTLKMRFMQLNFNAVKIVGSALNENADWHSGIDMFKITEGEFVYAGKLYNRDGNTDINNDMGKFKFYNQDVNDLVFCSDTRTLPTVELEHQYAMSLQKDANDNKFHVNETGIYTVYVNLKTMSMKFMKIDKSVLYIAGVAAEAVAMDKDDETDGVFTWKGSLVASQDFYFLNYNGYASSSIVADSEQSQAISLATEYDLDNDAALKNYYFKVDESDNYIVTVNLNTMKMKVEEDLSTNLNAQRNSEQVYSIKQSNTSLTIQIKDGNKAERIDIYDSNGRNVAGKVNTAEITMLKGNLPKGMYIVKLVYNGKSFSEKVIIE